MTDLRKLAEACLGGPSWPTYGDNPTNTTKALIQACTPSTILALLDRAERAERELDAALQEVEDQRLEKEIAEKQRDEARAALELRPAISPEDAAVFAAMEIEHPERFGESNTAVGRMRIALRTHAAKVTR